jgi:hypothetical protein
MNAQPETGNTGAKRETPKAKVQSSNKAQSPKQERRSIVTLAASLALAVSLRSQYRFTRSKYRFARSNESAQSADLIPGGGQ